jgi:hypothetical protein
MPREKITPTPRGALVRSLKHNARENMRNPHIRSALHCFFHGRFG